MPFPKMGKAGKEAGLWVKSRFSFGPKHKIRLKSPFNIHVVKPKSQLDIYLWGLWEQSEL